ncbi:unnamed protein product [Adineta ricciae]|uniref:G-protein coupled receptors family 1 profile domain-containing protein n=1 Tax=Adineta ricciae TaxID=249248 RepID=A0A815P912_ADIRI|nr:unnamed protein product [Adineta ricciae]CAF1446123.1 unnamed protein product [Adineta ricciae]
MSSLAGTLPLIQKNILFGLSWLYVSFGVTGCILNIFLFSRKQFRTTSCCKYFLASSVGMLCNLLIYSIPTIYGYYYTNPLTYNVPFCKFRSYFNHITSVIFRLILSAASFDRFALSSSNVRLRNLANVKFVYRIIASIVILAFLVHIYMLIVYNIKSNSCYNSLDAVGITLVSIFALTNNSFLPTTLMVIFTIFIRKNLATRRERRQRGSVQVARVNQNKEIQFKRDQQVLRMLFVQVIAFFVITSPYMVYSINNIISPYIQNKSSDRVAIENFVTGISGGLSYVFPAVSFYLYTLTSSLFRNELYLMLRSSFCFCCRNQHQHIQQIN